MEDDPHGSKQIDALALEVGRALAMWGRLEMHLSGLFAAISGMENNRAYVVFASVVNFDARLAMCTVLIQEAEDAEGVRLWAKLATRMAKFYKKRHEIAHFMFMASENNDGALKVRVAPFWSVANEILETRKELSRDDIELRGKLFGELGDAVFWFSVRADRRKRGTLQASPPPIPDLIARFQETAAQTPEGDGPPPQSSEG